MTPKQDAVAALQQRNHDDAAFIAARWHRLPEPVRQLVRSLVTLQARCDGEDVDLPADDKPRGPAGEHLTPAELVACQAGACRLVLRTAWVHGQEIAIVDRDGHRVKLGVDTDSS